MPGYIEEIAEAERIAEPEEQAILAPVVPGMSYEAIHNLSQGSPRGPDAGLVTTVRRTATIRAGTRMVKLLSGRQVGAYLHGRRPAGFCYREFDLTPLRTPAELSLLFGDAMTAEPAPSASACAGARSIRPTTRTASPRRAWVSSASSEGSTSHGCPRPRSARSATSIGRIRSPPPDRTSPMSSSRAARLTRGQRA